MLVTQPAQSSDLAQINTIVLAAVETWQLAPRLARLVATTHQYESADFFTMDFYFLRDVSQPNLNVGILALEPQPKEPTVMLHGLYILPEYQNRGFGTQAVELAKQFVLKSQHQALLVKAHASAQNFFAKQKLELLPVIDPERDYPYRFFWSAV